MLKRLKDRPNTFPGMKRQGASMVVHGKPHELNVIMHIVDHGESLRGNTSLDLALRSRSMKRPVIWPLWELVFSHVLFSGGVFFLADAGVSPRPWRSQTETPETQ